MYIFTTYVHIYDIERHCATYNKCIKLKRGEDQRAESKRETYSLGFQDTPLLVGYRVKEGGGSFSGHEDK